MSKHSEHSSYRKRLIKHIFIGELLKLSWIRENYDLEIATPEFDDSGYDIIVGTRGVTRHIQLKTSHLSSKTSGQNVHMKLADKPSGCVVWIYFNDAVELGPYYFFGALPKKPLPDTGDTKTVKYIRGNKVEKSNIRHLSKNVFSKHAIIEEVYTALFGPENT